MIPMSDTLLESVYDLVNRQDGEVARAECARIALLAAQHRAQQLRHQRAQRAIEQRTEERKALKAANAADQQQRAALTSATGAVAPDQHAR